MKDRFFAIRLAVLLSFAIITQAAFVQAYAPLNTKKVEISFNNDWKFKRSEATGAEVKTFDDAAWTSVVLPHSVRDWVTPEDPATYLGICWYRKHFTLPDSLSGRKIFVEFGAAMQSAEVYVNGTLKLRHVDGFTPFTIDLTSDAALGTTENVIAVKLDTRPSTSWVPGNSSPDFQYYGGLYREARLYATDKLHLTDAVYANKTAGGGVFASYSNVSTGSATIAIKTHVRNENTAAKNCTVLSELVDSAGTIVQSATQAISMNAGTDTTFSQTITVNSPKLWHPNTPYLYILHTTIKDGTTAVDYCKTRLGIRKIQWTHANGFLINGTAYKTMGWNWNQDIYGIANAIPARSLYYEAKRIKEAGVNFVRCANYPHAPAFYDACDELGILVDNSIAGYQYYSSADSFVQSAYRGIKDIVRRDRNHACVVLWEAGLNESTYPKTWADSMNHLAHLEYPGDQMYTCGQENGPSFDVYENSAARNVRASSDTRSIFISTYGDSEFGGASSTNRVAREAGDSLTLIQCNNILSSINANRACSWFSMDAFQHGHDWAGNNVTSVNLGGAMDWARLPKHAYYLFQSQRDPSVIIPNVNSGPMVYIANEWNGSSSDTIKVFSNCEQVLLYLNDSLIATHTPVSGYANVPHPPFAFAMKNYTPGTLRAVGKIGGTVKATHVRKTPETTKEVRITAESDTIIADGSDARLVWIDLIDSNGTVQSQNDVVVLVNVSGGEAAILGPKPVAERGGKWATWVRGGTVNGKATFTVVLSGFNGGSKDFYLVGGTSASAVRIPSGLHGGSTANTDGFYKIIGNRFSQLQSAMLKNKQVQVFDIKGRLLKTFKTPNSALDLEKETGTACGIYLLRTRPETKTK